MQYHPIKITTLEEEGQINNIKTSDSGAHIRAPHSPPGRLLTTDSTYVISKQYKYTGTEIYTSRRTLSLSRARVRSWVRTMGHDRKSYEPTDDESPKPRNRRPSLYLPRNTKTPIRNDRPSPGFGIPKRLPFRWWRRWRTWGS